MSYSDPPESRKSTWHWTLLFVGLGSVPATMFLGIKYQTRHYGMTHWLEPALLLAALWCCVVSPFLSSLSLSKKILCSVIALVLFAVVAWASEDGSVALIDAINKRIH
jgi:hypothetical protein